MFEIITLLSLSIFANALIGISTVIQFYFGLWYHWFLWMTVFGMYDVWTWFHQEYRDSFKICRSLFFRVIWKNRFFRPGMLPVHIIAACVLLHKKQERERKEIKGFKDVNEVFKNTNTPSWMTNLAVAQKYMKVSLAMYGWKYAIHRAIFNSYRGLLKFHWTNLVCFIYRPRHCVVKGDFWRRNLAGLISQSDLSQKDIYLASFQNELFAIPFCVSVRTETRSIVISLRGSLSMSDWITDFTATLTDPVKIHNGYRAHKGMWQSAKYVFCQLLETEKILQKLFEDDKYKDFDLVVTGHSLGAGTSVLLGVLLREVYHDKVKVYAFSCPGWLVDAELAKVCEDYVLVFGVGDDIVLRAGLNSMNKLVEDATNELKGKITDFDRMLSAIYKWAVITAKTTWNSSMNNDNIYDTAPLTVSLMRRTEESDQLYLPGRILHITKDRDMLACKGDFTMRLADKDEFLEILVMQTMFHDHIQENVMHAIDTLASYQDTKTNMIVSEVNGKP